MEWISAKDRLPEIPEGRYGVTVLVTTFDSIFEEINPGCGQSVTTMTFNKEHGDFGEFFDLPEGPYWMPSGDPVTHWMPMPEPPERG